MIKFSELTPEYLLNAFEIFQIHVDGTLEIFENNLMWKLSISVFKELFEGKNNFNKINEEKVELINILINVNDPKQEKISFSKMNNVMIDILIEKNSMALSSLNQCLFNLGIDQRLIYLLFLLIKYRTDKTDDLIQYLALILKQKYTECDFIFQDAMQENFFEFCEKISNFFEKNQLENFSIIKYDKAKGDLTITAKQNKEIEDSITDITDKIKKNCSVNSKKKKKKKKKTENKESHQESNLAKENEKEKSKDGPKKEMKKDKEEINEEKSKDEIKSEIKEDEPKKGMKEDETQTEEEMGKINQNQVKEINVNENLDEAASRKNMEDFQKLYNEIKKDNEEIKRENEEIKRENEDIKKKYNEIKKENEDIKKKYDEIKKENEDIKENYLNLNNKYKEIIIQNKKFQNDLLLNRKKCENLNSKLTAIKKETANLNFILKIIGLRTAYKTLVDLFVIIFNIDKKENLIDKINLI